MGRLTESLSSDRIGFEQFLDELHTQSEKDFWNSRLGKWRTRKDAERRKARECGKTAE